ncbi:MAG: hypothetical protein NVSMB18_06420 [Acetobacteraceae bacterium]
MDGRCDTSRYALAEADLARLARQLGFGHLARRLARHPGSRATRRFARQLALAAAQARHLPHDAGQCRRVGQLGGNAVVLLTVPDGARHLVRSARRQDPAQDGAGEEAEALFDTVIN